MSAHLFVAQAAIRNSQPDLKAHAQFSCASTKFWKRVWSLFNPMAQMLKRGR